MAEPVVKHNTGIQWTHFPGHTGETWNPLIAFNEEGERGWFCEHVSPGCENCYAEHMNVTKPFGMGTGYPYIHQNRKHHHYDVVRDPRSKNFYAKPLMWQSPRGVFVDSMTDLFFEGYDNVLIDYVFAVMCMAAHRHKFLVLTKRIKRMAEYLSDPAREERLTGVARGVWHQYFQRKPFTFKYPHPNILVGPSVENQRFADERLPYTKAISDLGWRTMVSYEPALGLVDWKGWSFINWLIIGGESSQKMRARPMHPHWVRETRNYCQAMNIPFFFKQWGDFIPIQRAIGDTSHREKLFVHYHTGEALEYEEAFKRFGKPGLAWELVIKGREEESAPTLFDQHYHEFPD